MGKNYCEPCGKFFKDKNGMKCHLNSEKHRIRAAEYAANKAKFMGEKSDKFQEEFLQLLKIKFANKKMPLRNFMLDFFSKQIFKILIIIIINNFYNLSKI